MNKIAILYGTSGGSVESVAKQVQDLFEGNADIYNVLDVSLSEIEDYKYIIVGTSTTGIGDLQDDWEGFLPSFAKIDFTGKKVAIFALGDSASYSTSFAESMKVVYDEIHDKVEVVGKVPDVGYTYDDSTAVEDGVWVGLPLDEDNEYDLTEERLIKWVEQLKKEFV
ncbi:MAG TPA: flavodoxin [Fermentimonas caenicola]|jgi:flavodoxin I|uniref:Flavodoxin n=1 Tax=Fermentimonas caenicola TaxID=1562970 RepID=A0A098C2D3_9BACT|nr:MULTISPECIES: flavodoxin [Lascolabacillus]MBP6175289.1 flavodoxin [Fermentimonas sp.]MDI9626470.1 flavodoxin [Bacteroidota bacterium]TAH60444.1 MAG: flavodoxin [Fermentimonas caenicola]MBP6196773.1 flavodoxin [Fermentimonas sp.]MBP7104756.1 flavodoxin [Fermentimonas sp.]